MISRFIPISTIVLCCTLVATPALSVQADTTIHVINQTEDHSISVRNELGVAATVTVRQGSHEATKTFAAESSGTMTMPGEGTGTIIVASTECRSERPLQAKQRLISIAKGCHVFG